MEKSFLNKLIESVIEETLLDEAKIDSLIKANPDYSLALEYFTDLHPKYLTWVLKQLKAKRYDNGSFKTFDGVFKEYLEDMVKKTIKALEEFEKYSKKKLIQNKDINTYQDLEQLEKEIEDVRNRVSAAASKKKAKADKDVVYDDGTYFIIKPKTEGASCYYGKGTQWCISADTDNQFKSHVKQGYEFLFIINKKTNDKDAIAYKEEGIKSEPEGFRDHVEIFDAQDKQKSFIYLNKKYPEEILSVINKSLGLEKTLAFFLSKFDHLKLPKDIMHVVPPEDISEEVFEFVLNIATGAKRSLRMMLFNKHYGFVKDSLKKILVIMDNLKQLKSSDYPNDTIKKHANEVVELSVRIILGFLNENEDFLNSGELAEAIYQIEKEKGVVDNFNDFVEPWMILDKIKPKAEELLK